MTLGWEDVLKVVLALVAGGLIGIEREFRDKAAGFRTLILICVGAALFTILSDRIADPPNARIAANIVSGVGFLGAGVILKEQGERVVGLTTAALIWLVAAVGMGLGAGYYLLSGVVGVLVLVVLWAFPLLERIVGNIQDGRVYEVVVLPGSHKCAEVGELLRASGRRVKLLRQERSGDKLTVAWHVIAHTRVHDELGRSLLNDAELLEVRC
jgi:putative Mg2+ transporter-C (MgtC) family protein